MKIGIKSIYLNLRRQPVISIVTIIGTSLAIFLIMIVVMLAEIGTAPITPENNRPRMMHQTWTSIKSTDPNNGGSWNGAMSYSTFKGVFGVMETPEAVTAYNSWPMKALLQEPGGIAVPAVMKGTDDVYWKVFDYDFIAGQPYGKAEFEAGMPVAVITANAARNIFGTTDVVGREMLLNYVPYRVCGVVKDVSAATRRTFAQVFVPFLSNRECNLSLCGDLMGSLAATILARSSEDFDRIRDEYNASVARYDKEIASTNWKMDIKGRPYVQEKEAAGGYSQIEPDLDATHRQRLVIYMILLLVPAINLSSMTESRLRGRMSEIGVRRAFGCTRSETMLMILAENLLVTVVAGIIGLVLSVIFAYFVQDYLFVSDIIAMDIPQAKIAISSLLHWSTFIWALVFCFILNLLSTGIPAWRASRANIVESIAGLRK